MQFFFDSRYFGEFGFVTRALRIPNKDEPKRKFGFVDFDDYDAVDIVVGQRDHFIEGHRVRVELALPLINDSLYEKDIVVPGETWIEKVQRKLQYAIPDHGTWGETLDNYAIFVQGGPDVKTIQFKIPRGMLGMFFIRLKIKILKSYIGVLTCIMKTEIFYRIIFRYHSNSHVKTINNKIRTKIIKNKK